MFSYGYSIYLCLVLEKKLYNVHMNYSTLRRRIAAAVIDVTIMSALGGISVMVTVFLALIAGLSFGGDDISLLFYLVLAPFVVIFFYGVGMSAYFGGTVGKLVLGMQVVEEDGKKIGFLRALLREFYKLFGFFLLNGFLTMFHNKNRRAWYDRMSGTHVVRK
jgi:uncharacterized RDD family membrane protein YckC